MIQCYSDFLTRLRILLYLYSEIPNRDFNVTVFYSAYLKDCPPSEVKVHSDQCFKLKVV